MPQEIEVSGLFIYPVKSLAGISLESSGLDSMGMKYDRRWMVVSPDGRFLTQRTLPQMALIKTAIIDGVLTLSKEGMREHRVPQADHESSQMEVTIWDDTVTASHIGDSTDAWLSEAIGVESHLVYIPDDVVRQCDLKYSEVGERTGFADGYPMLIISEASLEDLNQRLEHAVDMRRFRPNIVIKGCDAFAEDKLESFSIAEIPMRGVKLCSRCPMPTVDPDKGERAGQEPIATLMKYRKWDNKVFFGMNVIHQQQGTLKVGDKLNLSPN